MEKINLSSYMPYKGKNYGVNSIVVSVGHLDLYFSYQTIIAFRDNTNLVCCENVFSTTTGKHLNVIMSDKTKRVDVIEFNRLLMEMLDKYQLYTGGF